MKTLERPNNDMVQEDFTKAKNFLSEGTFLKRIEKILPFVLILTLQANIFSCYLGDSR